MNIKNKEIDNVKRELGNTINKLTSTEIKVNDLQVSLEQSKDKLGKASIDSAQLAQNLKEEK